MVLRLAWQDHYEVELSIVKIIYVSKTILIELFWHGKITMQVKLSIMNINFSRCF